MVRPVRAPAPVVTVRVAASGTRQGEGVADPRLKVRLGRVEASAKSASGRAGASEHGAVPVIVRVVVARPVEGAAALVVSVRTVFVRPFPSVRTAAFQSSN